MEKDKFLVPNDLMVIEFYHIIRKKLQMKDEKSLFLLVNESLMPKSDATMIDIYQSHKNLDGFLYISYAAELGVG